MAELNRNSSRKSYFLSVTPVNYSLTAGTDIPPPESPGHIPEPPTPGGGPLTSHPATPPTGENGYFEHTLPKPEPELESYRGRADSVRSPTSPVSSAAQLSSSPQQAQRQQSRVRKLLSLNNLRSSFNSSRTTLSLPRGSNDTNQEPPHTNGTKRPASPSTASTHTSSIMARPKLREKKSGGNWFRRKSSLFMLNDDNLDPVDENQRPDTRESKRLKESPPPLLPEIGSLRGGRISGGDLGWDERAFKR